MSGAMAADAITVRVQDNILRFPRLGFGAVEATRALRIVQEIRDLPDYAAMSDGRKWSQLPIFVRHGGIPDDGFGAPSVVDSAFPVQDVHMVSLGNDISPAYRRMRQIVFDYYRRLMGDYEDAGLMVVEERGNLRVKPALRARSQFNGKCYYGPADRRRFKWFTMARNLEADVEDLVRFKELIDLRRETPESKLHHFLADAPHFITTQPLSIISHPRFDPETQRRELDFFLRPYLDQENPGSSTILEIKRADTALLSDLRKDHPILAGAVFKAINQVRNYRRFIDDPANRAAVERTLGRVPSEVKVAILIGRRSEEHGEIFKQQLADWSPDVTLITYDDLYDVRERAINLY